MSTNNKPVAASFIQKLNGQGLVDFQPYVLDMEDQFFELKVIITELPDSKIGSLIHTQDNKAIVKNKSYSIEKVKYVAKSGEEQKEVIFSYYIVDSQSDKSLTKTVTINEFEQKKTDQESDLIGTQYDNIIIADAYKGYKIWGAVGNDTLAGNLGENIFVISNSSNHVNTTTTEIRNFELNEDKIDLSQLTCVQSIGDLKIDSKGASTEITIKESLMYPQTIILSKIIPNSIKEKSDEIFIFNANNNEVAYICAVEKEVERGFWDIEWPSFVKGASISTVVSIISTGMHIYNCIVGKYARNDEVNNVLDTSGHFSVRSNNSEFEHKVPIGITFEEDKDIDLITLKDSNTNFAYDGVLSKTSWVGKSDGILFYDYDGSKVANDNKIVMTSWSKNAKTDFEALLESFDNNNDKIFDKDDEKFNEFYVWQDKNSNGVVDKEELKALDELGIKSINFNTAVSANDEQSEQGILNVATVEWEDGKVTKAYDLVFQVEEAVI